MDSELPSKRLTEAAKRLEIALEMFGVGESLMRQKLRREHPQASSDEIEVKILAWLRTRPGAEQGDAVGRSLPVPR
jgi:hypothetical protein